MTCGRERRWEKFWTELGEFGLDDEDRAEARRSWNKALLSRKRQRRERRRRRGRSGR